MDATRGTDVSLHRLAVFVEVVDRAGYSAAAEHLGMAQPSISYHVRALERTYGADLVVYANRRVEPTAEGRAVYRTAKLILNEAAGLSGTIDELRSGRIGRLAIGASIAFEQQFFFDDVLAPFVDANNGISMSLRFGHSVELAHAVSARSLELAYVNEWPLADELTFERLHESDLVFLVAEEHPLARRRRVTAAEVNAAGLISAPLESAEEADYTAMLRAVGITSPNTVLEVDGVQARVLAARAGVGVLPTFAPRFVDGNAMRPLRKVVLDATAPSLNFGVVSRRDQPWSVPMELFVRWLRDQTRI